MKTLTNNIYNWAVNRFFEIEGLGVLECEDSWDSSIVGYLPDDVQYSSGASRMCFIFDEIADWIVKVDFKGKKGYCEAELNNYKDAVEKGLDKYFATTYKLTELDDGRIVIIQEVADIDEDAVSDEWCHYLSSDKSWLDEEHREDPEYVYDCMGDMDESDRLYAIFGDDKCFNELDSFCMDHHINDLHQGNWGINEGGSFILIDFAGYGMI